MTNTQPAQTRSHLAHATDTDVTPMNVSITPVSTSKHNKEKFR